MLFTQKRRMTPQIVLQPRVEPQRRSTTMQNSRRAYDDELTQRLTEICRRDHKSYENQIQAMAVRQQELKYLLSFTLDNTRFYSVRWFFQAPNLDLEYFGSAFLRLFWLELGLITSSAGVRLYVNKDWHLTWIHVTSCYRWHNKGPGGKNYGQYLERPLIS